MPDADVAHRAPEVLKPTLIFLWAAGGSLAVEVMSLYNEMKAERPTGLPTYYKNLTFWLVRLIVASIAGGLAVAEAANSALIAINIGASAPALLQLLSRAPQSAALPSAAP